MAKHERNIVTISYFPIDSDDTLIDQNASPGVMTALGHQAAAASTNVRDMLEDWVTRMIDTALSAITAGSRYRHSLNPSAPASLHYTQLQDHRYGAAVPFKSGILPSGDLIDLNRILQDHNVCDLVDNKNVREIWIMKTSMVEGLAHPEFYISSPQYSHWQQMNWLSNPAPVCHKTYTVVVHDMERWDLLLHVWYHAVEATMRMVDEPLFRLWQGPCDSNWGCYPGSVDAGKIARCGNCHNAPNARSEYDIVNPNPVLSDCLDFNPDGPGGFGAVTQISCHLWGCSGASSIESNSATQYTPWNLQFMPGHGNEITHEGKLLRNWWDAYVEFDTVIEEHGLGGDGMYCG